VELVVVVEEEVVGVVVVVFPTVLASFLDASPAIPDAFPGILALSNFAFRSPYLSFVVVPAFGRQHWIGSSEWRIHFCLLLIDNPPFLALIVLQGKSFGRQNE
jgi:hypothetical protein